MMRAWRRLLLAGLFVSLLAGLTACSGSGSSDDPDGDSDALPIGAPCTSNPECESRLCYPTADEQFCTRTCSVNQDCSDELGGSCCQRSPSEQNICYPAHLCIPVEDGDAPDGDSDGDTDPDGDDTDGDLPPTCTAGEKTCQGRNVMTCLEDGSGWMLSLACGAVQICQNGECLDESDGDTDTDGDNPDYDCRPPKIIPEAILYAAERAFMPEASNPESAASIYQGSPQNPVNPRFEDGSYVRLDLPGRDAGPLDGDGKVQELAFYLDVDLTYAYSITIDYVCGINFGQVELYLNDSTTPLKRVEGAQPDTHIDLNCAGEGIYSEKRLPRISYEPICIEEGEHILRARVRGKASASDGYSIGVDYLMVIPDLRDQFTR